MNICERSPAASAALTGCALALNFLVLTPTCAQDASARALRTITQRVDRFGDQAYETIVRTDERYGHDGLFQGPRGWGYWNFLEYPKPIQNPNLWPDMQSTYFFSRFALPPGSTLTMHCTYPYARNHGFALYKAERNTFVSINEKFAAPEIEPDAGSTNPYRIGADRLAKGRNFTLRVVGLDAPADSKDRERNTLYAGATMAVNSKWCFASIWRTRAGTGPAGGPR
jgi:hypothetical protein